MNKKIRIIPIVLSAVLLSACGEKESSLPEQSSSAAETTTTSTTAEASKSEPVSEVSSDYTDESSDTQAPEQTDATESLEWYKEPYLEVDDIIVPIVYVNDEDEDPNWYLTKVKDNSYGIAGSLRDLEDFTRLKSSDKEDVLYSEYGFDHAVICPLHGITLDYGNGKLGATISNGGMTCNVSSEYIPEGHGLGIYKEKEEHVMYSENHKTLWIAEFIEGNEIDVYSEEEAKDRFFAVRKCEYESTVITNADMYQNIGDKYALFNGYEQITDFVYDEILSPSSDSIISMADKTTYFSSIETPICVRQNDKYFYIDKNGKPINDVTYTAAYAFTEGFAAVAQENGYGYIDASGKEIIPVGTFENAKYVCNGRAWVKKDGKWGILQLSQSRIPSIQRDVSANVTYTGKLISKTSANGTESKYYLAADKELMCYKFTYINNTGIMEQPSIVTIKEIGVEADKNYDELVGKTVKFTGRITALSSMSENAMKHSTNPFLTAESIELAE